MIPPESRLSRANPSHEVELGCIQLPSGKKESLMDVTLRKFLNHAIFSEYHARSCARQLAEVAQKQWPGADLGGETLFNRRVCTQIPDQHRFHGNGRCSRVQQHAGVERSAVSRVRVAHVTEPIEIGTAQQRRIDQMLFSPKLKCVVHQYFRMCAVELFANVFERLIDSRQRFCPISMQMIRARNNPAARRMH